LMVQNLTNLLRRRVEVALSFKTGVAMR
jgi:hypothetical protein